MIEHIEDWHFYDGSMDGLCFVDERLAWFTCRTDPLADGPRSYDLYLLDAEAVRRMTDDLTATIREDGYTDRLDGYLADRSPLMRVDEAELHNRVEMGEPLVIDQAARRRALRAATTPQVRPRGTR